MLLPYFDFFSACFVLYRPFNSKLSIPLFCNYARFVQFPFPGRIAVPGFFEIPKVFLRVCGKLKWVRGAGFFLCRRRWRAGGLVVGSVVGRIWKRRKGEKREIE